MPAHTVTLGTVTLSTQEKMWDFIERNELTCSAVVPLEPDEPDGDWQVAWEFPKEEDRFLFAMRWIGVK